MDIVIDTSQKQNYVFRPSLEVEIQQNIYNIINRIKGDVVLARHKGIDSTIIDKPNNIMLAQLSANIVTEIEKEEPRFKVTNIDITSMENSTEHLIIKLKGGINA